MRNLLIYIFISFTSLAFTQTIPSDRVLEESELFGVLKESVQTYFSEDGEVSSSNLAAYFRRSFSRKYFYDYRAFYDRLRHYNGLYCNEIGHQKRAFDHMAKYTDSTQWQLPFDYLNGEPVNAYALRHLARQHKMVDIAFHYFNAGKDPKYIEYFTNQMRSLNAALHAGEYEKIEDGNGVYEAFRSGYRILNWLWIHNMFLNEESYTDEDQLTTIATLLQHGQHLYERNEKYKAGNHQTRGVSALAMLAILFSDFEGTDQWLERAMLRLGEHLEHEINDDGFQFERSVHYHMSDINNYFFVYQLAKQNDVKIEKAWEEKLMNLFSTLVMIAYPDRSAPVLQDDTEIPWAEKNDISGAMTLGYLLFEIPEFGYFASDKVDEGVYWFLSERQVKLLKNIQQKRPSYFSLDLPETHYYIMREGWEPGDKMMIISAGVDSEKPDHQHGDILGIQAIANGHAILPNYQVRYSLKDLELFKNSMVKNVALVDEELQGKKWTSNKGGSGFGKFRKLPHPEVLSWEVNEDFDFFAGRHDGFEHMNVAYSRQVIFIKDDFWIVKDNFKSEIPHDYKQVWQGHYTCENGPDLLRATAADASGHDILQLYITDKVSSDGARGKQWSIIQKSDQKDFSFLTIIYPYRGYNNRLKEDSNDMKIGAWEINNDEIKLEGEHAISISSAKGNYFFRVKEIITKDYTLRTNREIDLYVKDYGKEVKICSLSPEIQKITVFTKDRSTEIDRMLNPGESLIFHQHVDESE